MATSEAVPLAKTGGLADVCGSLPIELARQGHEVTLFLPAFRSARRSGVPLEATGVELTVPIGSKTVTGGLLKSRLPGSEVTVYLVEQDSYYDRKELYREAGQDYIDNCERFVFFCRAVMKAICRLSLPVDILHVHDWQTGLIPALLKIEYAAVPPLERTASVLTIHNLAYQGQFWHWDMALTGLDWKYFNWQQMEFFGHLNLLKTGIVFADALSTVSPRYAEEIQGPEQGCGLEGVLRTRRDVLRGIINGVDQQRWNPQNDPHLAMPYGVDHVAEGKAACKAALQGELSLPVQPRVPLLGLVGRLADQKGWDLLMPVLEDWATRHEVQWAILGTGEPKYHEQLGLLAERHPSRIALRLEFSETLAHRIEAGADMFVMPSHYEPCGLNQLYSLKYGTIPLVRATGGLADTVTDLNDETLSAGTATGFSFRDYSSLALSETLERACNTYWQQPKVWSRLIHNAMRQDWSWARSAREYIELYTAALARKNSIEVSEQARGTP